jgi:ATP-dependent helicase/nuclease subunit A
MTTSEEELARADLRAREVAQTVFDVPIVLEAGAGTGKTAVLVSRVVSWALGKGWERQVRLQRGARVTVGQIARRVVEGVVALTFTERAAAEMEQRVIAAFSLLASGCPVVGFSPQATGIGAEELVRRANALSAATPQLNVGTIHGFCRQILVQNPLEANLHPAFVVDGDGSAIGAIVEQTLVDRLTSWWGNPGDGRCARLAANGVGPVELAESLRVVLVDGLLDGVDDSLSDWLSPPRVSAALERFCGNLTEWLELASVFVGCGGGRGLRQAVEAVERAQALSEEMHDLREVGPVIERLSQSTIDPLRERLDRWSRGRFGVKELELVGMGRERFVEASEVLRRQMRNLERVDPASLGLLIEVLGELAQDARERMRRAGIAAFPDLLRLTERLLRSDATVRRRVRGRIDQLLVDEFQDTDVTQCEILRWLALDGRPEERPALFLVGDPKQSIYGWRDADMAAYERFVSSLRPLGGARYMLSRNYRSVPAILREVERVVEPVMREVPGLQPPFQPLIAGVNADQGDSPSAVEYWVAWDPYREKTTRTRARELEAEALAADLRRMHDSYGVPWAGMALLMRTLTNQDPYLAALRAADVPYLVDREQSYFRRREVIDAAALVRVVLDPLDEVALVTLLRSLVVGVPDDALYLLFTSGFGARMREVDGLRPEATEQAHRTAKEAAALSDQNDAAWVGLLGHAIDAIALLRRSRARVSLEELLEMIRAAFPLEALEAGRYLGEHRLARLDGFFASARETLVDGGGVGALLRRLRLAVAGEADVELATGGDGDASVRVMSIHKAKGLTFDCVYLVGMHSTGRGAVARGTLDWGRLADGSLEVSLLGWPTLDFDLLERRRERVAAAEAVRTLYVACTRPRRRLVLSGCWPEKTPAASRGDVSTRQEQSHVELLARRVGGAPDLQLLRKEAADGGREVRVSDAHDVEWVQVHPGVQQAASAIQAKHALGVLEELSREPEQLRMRQQAAQQRMANARILSVTAGAEPAQDPALHGEAGELQPPLSAGSAEGARLAGTAVHRLIELIDLSGDLRAQLAEAGARLAEIVGEQTTSARVRTEALERSEAIIARLLEGGCLIDRLSAVSDQIVGREIPLLVTRPDGTTCVGALDLLYMDSDTADMVVVDFKTDRICRTDELQRRAEQYASQGAAYAEAVMRALHLAQVPRFEVWFLWADSVVCTPINLCAIESES